MFKVSYLFFPCHDVNYYFSYHHVPRLFMLIMGQVFRLSGKDVIYHEC